MKTKKAVFNWSGGKDSALALYKILNEGEYEVVSLLTTVNRDNGRSSMHGIPLRLLEKQAESIGIPLYKVGLIPDGSMSDYETVMRETVEHFKELGVEYFIFGDIFLHDVRSYREKQLEPYGIKVVEPLWGKDSFTIMQEFIASGLKTVIVTTMADLLDESFVGRHIDADFVNSLPEGIDICGENGEYHTFCYAGGMFRKPVEFALGKPFKHSHLVKLDNGEIKRYFYWFADLQ